MRGLTHGSRDNDTGETGKVKGGIKGGQVDLIGTSFTRDEGLIGRGKMSSGVRGEREGEEMSWWC